MNFLTEGGTVELLYQAIVISEPFGNIFKWNLKIWLVTGNNLSNIRQLVSFHLKIIVVPYNVHLWLLTTAIRNKETVWEKGESFPCIIFWVSYGQIHVVYKDKIF